MKLYFYFLIDNGKPEFKIEECEVIEHEKSFVAVDQFPSYYYGFYILKDELNIIHTHGITMEYVTTERNDPKIAKAFLKHISVAIKMLNKQMNMLKKRQNTIREWLYNGLH